MTKQYFLGCFLPAAVSTADAGSENFTQWYNLTDYSTTVKTNYGATTPAIKIDGIEDSQAINAWFLSGFFAKDATGSFITGLADANADPCGLAVFGPSRYRATPAILFYKDLPPAERPAAPIAMTGFQMLAEVMPLTVQEVPNTYTRAGYNIEIIENSETITLDDGRTIKAALGPLGRRCNLSFTWPAVEGLKDSLNAIILKAAAQPAPLIYIERDGATLDNAMIIWPDSYALVQEAEAGVLSLTLSGSCA